MTANTKLYFHQEFTRERIEAELIGKVTIKEIMDNYSQPDWCDYPNALEGLMGCWSLNSGLVTGEDYCRNCDCYGGLGA